MKNFIFLNGKSFANAELPRNLTNKRLFAINRKAKIEKQLERNIDYWAVFSPPEVIDMVEDIYKYLNREENNFFITTSFALFHIREYIEARGLPNCHKIILLDNLCSEIDGKARLEDVTGKWNSVSVILYYLALNDIETPTYIWGMDGAENEKEDNLYFNQDSLPKKRGNAIYKDMIFFDKNFNKLMNKKGLKPQIFNMNQETFYKSFKFPTEREKEINSASLKSIFSTKYSLKQILNKIELISSRIKSGSTSDSIDGRIDYLIKNQEYIIKKLKKKHWFLRILKK